MSTDAMINDTFQVRSGQKGFVLLDALIAILVFSIGILGLVALQGTAIKLAGDAQYRTNAAMLADQVIAQMWGSYDPVGDPNGTAFATAYAGSAGTGGTAYTAWAKTIDCTSSTASTSCLPGAAANPPSITVDNSSSSAANPNSLVTVTVYWKSPNDTGPHDYVSITQVSH